MSQDWQADVADFHKVFGVMSNEKPIIPKNDNSTGMMSTKELRKRLILEECLELTEALDSEDLSHIAKEIADVIVVTLGTAVVYGIKVQPIWDSVHVSNMAKIGGKRRADGKILKPEGWKPPDIASEIKKQQE
jgi:predicted HAD superfamily Cof-like phosphohydrolase